MLVLFVLLTIFDGVVAGSGGIVSTRLDGAIDEDDTTITVDSTSGFAAASATSYIMIGDEKIRYTGLTATTFTGGVRGYNNTSAKTHADNAMVYSPEAGALNAGVGFNIVTTQTTAGNQNLAVSVASFVWHTLPKIVTWDFGLLNFGPMVYFRILLVMISIAFIVMLIYAGITNLLQGSINR